MFKCDHPLIKAKLFDHKATLCSCCLNTVDDTVEKVPPQSLILHPRVHDEQNDLKHKGGILTDPVRGGSDRKLGAGWSSAVSDCPVLLSLSTGTVGRDLGSQLISLSQTK